VYVLQSVGWLELRVVFNKISYILLFGRLYRIMQIDASHKIYNIFRSRVSQNFISVSDIECSIYVENDYESDILTE